MLKLRMKYFVKPYILLLLFLFPLFALGQSDFEKIESRNFKNLYKLNDSIYRSEQPSRKGFIELEAMGVQSILNFRRLKEDRRKASSTDLNLNWIPIRTKELSEAQLVDALRVIKQSEKPILIHCWHGSDRTGAVAAAYRVIFQNWSKEDAIRELRYEEFGYHENWYPNIVELIENLDAEAIRKELEIQVLD
jgi:protein tyrosine/serine phosphatase